MMIKYSGLKAKLLAFEFQLCHLTSDALLEPICKMVMIIVFTSSVG